MTELTERQEAFCQAYARSPNGAGAARAAGYAEPSARNRASELLTKPQVAERIAVLREQAAADRAAEAAAHADKLEPFLRAALVAGDAILGLQIVAEQARIRGFVSGPPAIQLRTSTATSRAEGTSTDANEAFADLAGINRELVDLKAEVSYLRLKAQGFDVGNPDFWEQDDDEEPLMAKPRSGDDKPEQTATKRSVPPCEPES